MKYVGIDGCRAGWFYIGMNEGDAWEAGVFETISGISTFLPEPHLILIDIPIGLKGVDRLESQRCCDKEARAVLRPSRSSSVFPVPSRVALAATTYQQACEFNKAAINRRLSKQTWAIMPKIKEADDFLQENPSAQQRIREMHPEVCFWALNNGFAMEHNKKKMEGFYERKMVLSRICKETDTIIHHALNHFPRREVAKDDILDAFVGVVTAKYYYNCLATLPATPEFDEMNLPMEVVFPKNVKHEKFGL